MGTLLDKLADYEEFTTFRALVRKTSLVAVLTEPGPYTVFAPTDDAFDNLPEGTVNRLIHDIDKLTAILAYHIVPGRFTSEDAPRLASAVTTLEGSDLRVATSSIELTVNGAHVVHANMTAANGVLHEIDQVLVPLDDLGNVAPDYTDVIVVEPPMMVVVTSAGPATQEAEEIDDVDDIDM